MCGNRRIKSRAENWDDKFGVMDDIEPHHEFSDLEEKYSVKVEGVGKDAEVVTNSQGGKQSKSPMAMHLIDPKFLKEFAHDRAEALEYEDEGKSTTVDEEDVSQYVCYKAVENIADFMITNDTTFLVWAMDDLESEELTQVMKIAKVLQYGASRYAPNNWRLIPQEEHINHALIHIVAHLAGDRQDEHIDHALCRLMMAYATKKSTDFSYTEYVKRG